jgi:hypothetical protein
MPATAPPKDVAPQISPSTTREELAGQQVKKREMKTIVIAAVALAVVVIGVLIVAIFALLQPGTPTDRIRDVFIILVSFETLLVGAALVVLLVQLASLINLLQNEVRPMLQATSETISTLRGTADFLGESVVEPVLKLNGYLASIQRVLELMGIKRK